LALATQAAQSLVTALHVVRSAVHRMFVVQLAQVPPWHAWPGEQSAAVRHWRSGSHWPLSELHVSLAEQPSAVQPDTVG
jgi:hypothetical protein